MRPHIAIPGRRSETASALRFRAVVVAERLADVVYESGGEPVVILPKANAEARDRLAWIDGVILPGGADINPLRYGATVAHAEVYDVDDTQDAFDFAIADWALTAAVPLLAICRGLQVVNVVRGGTLAQHLPTPHRHQLTTVKPTDGSCLSAMCGTDAIRVSCFHHQAVATLGQGLVVAASADDGTVEALEMPSAPAFFTSVQWHPEDTFDTDPVQRRLIDGLVEAAAVRR
jgi:putative glutamine amidotransferase